MFAAPRKIITNITLIASLLLPGLAQADVQACFNFLDAQDYARAESEAKELLQVGNLDRVHELAAQLCLGRAYSGMGRTQDALPSFQRVEALSQTAEELAPAYYWLGLTYASLNDLDRAELYDQRALKANRKAGNKENEAYTLNNLATVARTRGNLERALQLFREALAILPEAKQAFTLSNIAMIHNERKEYKQAIKLLHQAIDIDRRNGDAHATAIMQINLGGTLLNTRQYSAAEKELLAGLNSIRLVEDKHWEAEACVHMWLLAKDGPKKNSAESRQWLEKAEALYREIGETATADDAANLLAGK